jgi:hypothetical protein
LTLTETGKKLANMIKERLDDKTILEKLNQVKELKDRDIEELVKEAKKFF